MAGKILKVKLGYNPNSSSIGSLFSAFLWVAAAGSFIMAAFSELRPGKDESASPDEGP
jgi:hypothetical protein